MTTARFTRCAAAIWTASALFPAAAAAAADAPSKPGAYCPLPEPGQVPQCQAPARKAFGDFFEAVETGEVDDSQERLLEAALVGGNSQEEPYLALSSLAYGYFRLAQRAAADPEARPELTARLNRWNQVLLEAYADSEADPAFQQAVREAARDLEQRAPEVSTEADLLELIAQADGRSSGLRGALEGFVQRVLGEDASN